MSSHGTPVGNTSGHSGETLSHGNDVRTGNQYSSTLLNGNSSAIIGNVYHQYFGTYPGPKSLAQTPLPASPQATPVEQARSSQQPTEQETGEFELYNLDRELHGLFVVYPTPGQANSRPVVDVDIVAVHGLKGEAKNTWIHRGSGKFWLEHFLPDAIPNSRIMSFGYDSTLAFSRSKSGIENFARDLLNRLRIVRSDRDALNRPLIFIAHSLGGIVVKKALIIAHEEQSHYGAISKSTLGIIFMGTPHRGSKLVPWAMLFSNIVNLAIQSHRVRKDLLHQLDRKASTLMDISEQFVHRAASLKIMSFIEQQAEHPLTSLTIPEYSAILSLPNEMIIPLNADHHSICRYRAKTQDYRLVEAAVRELANAEKPNSRAAKVLGTATKDASRIYPPNATTIFPSSTDTRSRQLADSNNLSSSQPSSSKTHHTFRQSRSLGQTKSQVSTTRTTVSEQDTSRRPYSSLDVIQVRISGLRNKLPYQSHGATTFSEIVQLPANAPIERIGAVLKEKQPRLKSWESFQFAEYGTLIDSTWTDVFTIPVEVTSGRSCSDSSSGSLKINSDEKIASFFSKVYPRPIEVKLDNHDNAVSTDPFAGVSSTSIMVGKGDLTISLMRTVRVPENTKVYDLPPDLGRFPIFNVRAFSRRLPTSVVAQGGLFFPMYQMEAMWINFEANTKKRFAIRPFLGGVNGISGEATIGDMNAIMRRMNSLGPKQDYIVTPDQIWLDGIATSPGIVKQFVATSMTPPRSKVGYQRQMKEAGRSSENSKADRRSTHPIGGTVEYQITGQDGIGGFQLQLIPEYNTTVMSAGTESDVYKQEWDFNTYSVSKISKAQFHDVMKTPRELGLQNTDIIHVKNLDTVRDNRPKLVGDLLAEAPSKLNAKDLVELSIFARKVDKWKFNACLRGGHETISLEFDEDDEFEGVIAYFQGAFALQNGVLHMKGFSGNAPLVPVCSWPEFHALRGILKTELSHRLLFRNGEEKMEWDVVLVDSNLIYPCRVCRVDVRKTAKTYGAGRTFCIALKSDATVLGLRRCLEDITGESLQAYELESGRKSLPSDNPVFKTNVDSSESPLPIFLIWYNSALINNSSMTVFVTTVSGRTITIDAFPGSTIDEVKSKIQNKVGSLDGCRLGFRRENLESDRTLSFYNIQRDNTISLSLMLRGGGALIYVMYKGQKEMIGLRGYERILEVKQKIKETLAVPVGRQVLSYEGRVLNNAEFINPYNGKILELSLSAALQPTMLGIGAGGSIEQHIERDTHNSRIWDVANSKILNIQIVDATTFKTVTGMSAPETPITAQTYHELGLPFFKLWRDELVGDGVAGEWGSIMGVAEVAARTTRLQKRRSYKDKPSDTGEIWGKLSSWVRGRLDKRPPDKVGDVEGLEETREVGRKEPHLHFPIVLLDIDDTLPPFRSVVEKDF